MKSSRRRFISAVAAGSLLSAQRNVLGNSANTTPWHDDIVQHAKRLSTGRPLRLLIPKGSGANVRAVTAEFSRLSEISCIIEEVAVDDINLEIILRETPGNNTIDVALPATFGLIDLVQAKAIIPLDSYAAKYQPAGFSEGYLYRKGDTYQGKLYGYQTDGDAYLLFYNKTMLENPSEIEAYRRLTGNSLQAATSWEDLDSMMAFFHRPDDNQYGGSLFRNAGYLVWEWWARFHAKGSLPFTEDMQANINNQHGIDALNEMIAASQWLSPGVRMNGLFDNWADFAKGNVFCNIGWGGTQKYLMNQQNMRDNMVHSALPGPRRNGKPTRLGYFNWGWNYTVSTLSKQPELAYLLTLFAASPVISTLAVREPDGYFDPFRQQHYQDRKIVEVYGDSFLNAHKSSLSNAIPDLYISGQSHYLDVLRQQIIATITQERSATQALNDCALQWSHITRRFGSTTQAAQWHKLLQEYPAGLRP